MQTIQYIHYVYKLTSLQPFNFNFGHINISLNLDMEGRFGDLFSCVFNHNTVVARLVWSVHTLIPIFDLLTGQFLVGACGTFGKDATGEVRFTRRGRYYGDWTTLTQFYS